MILTLSNPGVWYNLFNPGGGVFAPPLSSLFDVPGTWKSAGTIMRTSSNIFNHQNPLFATFKSLGVLLQKWSCKFIHRHGFLHFDFWLLYVLHYYIFYFYFNQNLKSCAWNPIENSLKCLSDIEEKSQEIWDLVDQSFFSYKAKTEGGGRICPPMYLPYLLLLGLENWQRC